ncbi:hypothetical protein ZIOFF_025189 [Zingiber officinale]|uniref:Cysteine-rich receptor-like protein kinase 10 n=1 Tax=Zingiber officinale TaxID=94328 RepID=A0A8J5LE20_ZINOF|nr:hypothetical protein ZIOFF_025189 [Zingiber officinale]
MNTLAKAARSSPKMFAMDNVSLPNSTNIYGLEQCTRDLSADDCYNCLLDAVGSIPTVSNGSQGCRVLGQSCSSRYEMYPFYNISAIEVVSPPLSLSPASSPTGNELKGKCCLNLIATDNFSDRNKLGGGGFGPVYKGTLENGEEVAVKRLSRSSEQGLDELKNEVFLVAKLRHRNLVRLLGCCLESEEKLLVYNYLANTSLDKFLFDKSKIKQLDSAIRFKIIEGISRGLLYLHEDSPLKIIHRDLKVSNILLDANMDPKISDFGLAKLFGVDETQGNTQRIAGTFGYMAPEYAFHGLFSVKSDVYSYGVLILEILTGQKNSGYRGSGYPVELVTHVVWHHWTQGSALQMIDQGLVEQCQAPQILRCIHIGLLCVQEDPIQRPTMANVVLMLNSHFVGLPTPSAPAFLSNRNTTSESNGILKRGNSSASKGNLMKISENNVSISTLKPR